MCRIPFYITTKELIFLPNWCSNTHVFYTNDENKDELLRLYNNLSAVMQTPATIKNDFEPGWLGQVAINHGLDWEKISCRGSIEHLDEYEPGRSFFKLESETAWSPTDALWEAVIAEYSGVSYVYIAEEPGNEIFTNTDYSGVYFPEKYLLDICGDAPIPGDWFSGQDRPGDLDIREYFENFDALVDCFFKITGKVFNNFEALQDYLSGLFDGAENTCANIHEFTGE